ncbi:MAG TPA: hypothetical protein VIQ31_08740 [Phormidium sp.]
MNLTAFTIGSRAFCIDTSVMFFDDKDKLIEIGQPLAGIGIITATCLLGCRLSAFRQEYKKTPDCILNITVDGEPKLAVEEKWLKALAVRRMSEGCKKSEKAVRLLTTEGVLGLYLSVHWGKPIDIDKLLDSYT